MAPPFFPPDEWSSIRVQFMRFAQGTTWPPGYRLSETWFKRAVIDLTYWFTYKGKGEITNLDTGETFPMHAGVCLLLRPEMRLSAAQLGEDGLGNLYFHANLLREDGSIIPSEEWPDFPMQTEVSDFDFFNSASRRLLSLLQRTVEADYPAKDEARVAAEHLFKGILLDLHHLHQLPRSSSTALYHQRAVDRALRALAEQPRPYSSVEAWAATSGYSASHFRTLFLKYTGKTPMEHIIHARMKLAKEYLRASPSTVGMIANQLGYENTHYFSRQFKKETGMTASEYREKIAQLRREAGHE